MVDVTHDLGRKTKLLVENLSAYYIISRANAITFGQLPEATRRVLG
jgi:hypothetical protein